MFLISKENRSDFLSAIVFFLIFWRLPFINYPIIFYDTSRTIGPFIKSCSVSVIPNLRDPLRYYQLCISDHVLNNVYTIPVISGIVLIIISFYYTKKITKSNLASWTGIIMILSSTSFSYYGFSATYDQTWVMLLFASLFILNTRWNHLAIIPFIISLGFRGLPLLDIPIIISQIIVLEETKKRKTILIMLFMTTAIVSIIYIINGGSALTQNQKFIFDLDLGLQSLNAFRMDIFFYLLIIPQVFLLFKVKTKQAGFLLFSITFLIFQTYCLSAFTNLGQEPYRMFPLIIFISIGYAYIISHLIVPRIKHGKIHQVICGVNINNNCKPSYGNRLTQE